MFTDKRVSIDSARLHHQLKARADEASESGGGGAEEEARRHTRHVCTAYSIDTTPSLFFVYARLVLVFPGFALFSCGVCVRLTLFCSGNITLVVSLHGLRYQQFVNYLTICCTTRPEKLFVFRSPPPPLKVLRPERLRDQWPNPESTQRMSKPPPAPAPQANNK